MVITMLTVRRKARVVCMLLVSCVLLVSCQKNEEPAVETVTIGDYVLHVEEAVGDSYNVGILYSLRRRDGEQINPHLRFETMESQDIKRSWGGGTDFEVSADGKTLWIRSERSSSNKYDSKELQTVIFRNLVSEEDRNIPIMEGQWIVSFRIDIDKEYIELLRRELEILPPNDPDFYLRISTIRLSEFGLHMEMKVPEHNVERLLNNFDAKLVMKDGAIIKLELHHSIRGNQEPVQVSGETLFEDQIKLENVKSIMICDQVIPVNIE